MSMVFIESYAHPGRKIDETTVARHFSTYLASRPWAYDAVAARMLAELQPDIAEYQAHQIAQALLLALTNWRDPFEIRTPAFYVNAVADLFVGEFSEWQAWLPNTVQCQHIVQDCMDHLLRDLIDWSTDPDEKPFVASCSCKI
jgi:hypothetical protein